MASLGGIAGIITAIAAVGALIGGYTQFVLVRSILPCIEFDVDFKLLQHLGGQQSVGDIVCSVKNVGPGVGFVTNVYGRVRYRLVGDPEGSRDGVEPTFPHAVPDEQRRPVHPESPATAERETTKPDVGTGRKPILGNSAFEFAPGLRNYIQPGVTQWYRKPLMVPTETSLIHVWAAFEYHIEVGRISRFLARFLVHSVEKSGVVPYTVRRTFTVRPPAGPDPTA